MHLQVEIERAISVAATRQRAYALLWDVPVCMRSMPGLVRCERVGPDRYRFVHVELAAGSLRVAPRYTASYRGNGSDSIRFAPAPAPDDLLEVEGELRLADAPDGRTRVELRQRLSAELPVPRLLRGRARGFAEREAGQVLERFLAGVRRSLETA